MLEPEVIDIYKLKNAKKSIIFVKKIHLNQIVERNGGWHESLIISAWNSKFCLSNNEIIFPSAE